MYDLNQFTLETMSKCSLALRQLGKHAESMEEAGQEITQYLYEHLIDHETQQKSCALIRLFTTPAYRELTPDLQESARRVLGNRDIPPALKCLTLLASTGDRPEWNSRHQSRGHCVVPLINQAAIAKIPMISQLIQQLGIDPSALLKPDSSLIMDLEQQIYNVFHVPEAVGSPYIPAQTQFVIPHKIKSVVGFGGFLPSGSMFAIILFLKVPTAPAALDLVRPLALSVKTTILPFDHGKIFADSQQSGRNNDLAAAAVKDRKVEQLHAQIANLKQLFNVYIDSARSARLGNCPSSISA
jgi:two-component system NtrC family sensor kinase